jgi:hypothetical protein
MVFLLSEAMPPTLDGKSIRAQQKAAGAIKKAPLRRKAARVRRLAALL